jgi:hypothetical protein
MIHTYERTKFVQKLIKVRDMRVLANAVVDQLTKNLFRVEVWGLPPHAETRIYEIKAKSDTLAAQEGIQRFVEEFEAKLLKDQRHADDAGAGAEHQVN